MVKVSGYFSSWRPLHQGVPQGSKLGPLLFKHFINDIFLFIQQGSLSNFADDSAVNADELHRLVQHNTNQSNHMTVNPSKFKSLIVGNNDNHITEFSINDGFKINVSSEVTLLGIQIDEQLKFDLHIDKVCKKAAIQLTQSKAYLNSWAAKKEW